MIKPALEKSFHPSKTYIKNEILNMNNPIHILSNISRSKSNQKIKLRQLTEYNKRNNFLQKLRGK